MNDRPPDPDREAFAALAVRVLVSAGVAESAEPILSLFAVEFRLEGRRTLLPLHDPFVESAPVSSGERAGVLAAWVRSVLGAAREETWSAAAPRLQAVVRNAWFGGASLVTRPALRRDLSAFLTLGPGQYLHPAHLKAWGITAKQAFDAALANLAANEPQEVEFEQEVTGILLPGAEPASLLLREDWVGEQEGRALAVPDRGTLWVAEMPDGEEAEWEEHSLGPRVLRAWEAATQPLAPVLFMAGTEEEYQEPEDWDEESNEASRLAERALRGETYAAQARAIRLQFPETELPLPELDRATGLLSCQWPEERDALLPRVNTVICRSRPDAKPDPVPWEKLMTSLGGSFVLQPGLFPPRWKVTAWQRSLKSRFEGEYSFSRTPDERAGELVDPETDDFDEPEGDLLDEADSLEDVAREPGIARLGGGAVRAESFAPDQDRREVSGEGMAVDEVEGVEDGSPWEAEGGSYSAAAHAFRLLETMVAAEQLALASPSSLKAVELMVAETLAAGGADWPALARALSARLLEMEGVIDLYLDDAALADLLERTAGAASEEAPADPVLAKARMLIRDLLATGGAEPVAGGSGEEVEAAVVEVLAEQAGAPLEVQAAAVHARLDGMDEDIVILTTPQGLGRLLGS